jgi:plasmid stability protein
MTSITVRNVPEPVRDELAARAARCGRSLQEYLLAEMVDLAARPPVAEWLDEVRERKRATGTRVARDEVLADVAADRR